jgi:diguanylate cyclase (GGDEF)-like protein/PAS domain S-box-containing protein
MALDIQTLAFIQCLVFITQVTVLLIQYRINRIYRGTGWWVLGSAFMAFGVIFMPMLTVKSLEMLARAANPLVVLGQIFLYVGIMRFIDKKENRWILASLYAAFLFFYYYFMYVNHGISARTVVVYTTIAVISIMTAYKLFFNKDRFISGAANFTAVVFLVYGCFSAIRIFTALLSPPIQWYTDQMTILELGFIIPTITSTLWTYGFIIMLNQRLNMENNQEKEKMQLIFNTSPDAVLITRLSDGLLIDVNVGFSVLTGYTHAEVIGNSTLKINLWHSIKEREDFLAELNKNGICKNMEFIFMRKDGSHFVGMISARPTIIYDVPHIISVIHDITERKHAEETLRESEETYRSILNASPDDITITDLKGQIIIISQAAKRMFGYEPSFNGFIGMQLLDFIVPEDAERAQANIKLMYQSNYSKPNEYRGIRKDQSIFDIEVNSGFVNNINGRPTKMVFIVRDITERKLAERQIKQLVQQLETERSIAELNSITDSLTGLANRRYFDDTLKNEFYRLKRSGSALSLIMLDIDHFKKFNDSYGHLAGDDCLRQIGGILKTIVLRIPDMVARYGGEEFVVILPETENKGAQALAERIRISVEELAIPHPAYGFIKKVTVSLGVVTVYPDVLESPEQVLAMVDEALYCAKKGGRNRIEIANC